MEINDPVFGRQITAEGERIPFVGRVTGKTIAMIGRLAVYRVHSSIGVLPNVAEDCLWDGTNVVILPTRRNVAGQAAGGAA